MAAMSIKGKEDAVTDAYKLGYEIGKKAEKERVFKAIDEFAERLKDISIKDKPLSSDDYGCATYGDINKIAEEMKGGAEC